MKPAMANMLTNSCRYNLNSQKIRLLTLMSLALTTAGCSYLSRKLKPTLLLYR